MLRLPFVVLVLLTAPPAYANDIVYLSGHVKMSDGSAPGRSVEIKLDCKGADHAVRQTVTDKKGAYHLRVERDEFDHVARALPATATDVGTPAGAAGACRVVAALAGNTSTSYDLGTLKIGKDLGVPDLVLTPAEQPK